MKLLLFDLYGGGHHLEYASRLSAALVERDPDLEVEFLSPGPAEHEEMFFDADQVAHLYPESPLSGDVDWLPDREPFATAGSFLSTNVLNPRWRVVRDVAAYAAAGEYDLVHCLEVDKLLPYLRCHFAARDLPLVGTVNGIYLKPKRSPLPATGPVRRLVEVAGTCRFVRHAPPFLHQDSDWHRWFMGQCLDGGVFDHLTVPTEEAAAEVRSTAGPLGDRVSVVPGPTERWTGGPEKEAARRRLDLPVDAPLLLFFGRICAENGIETLLSALERYDGPPFTMVLAGKPVAVSPEDVARVRRRADVDVVSRLEFVPQAEVIDYFHAADSLLFPYEPSFGQSRPSNVFQKACAAGRPVIASDFGVFRRRVTEWDLGLLCEPGSPDDLAATIAEFVARDGDVYDSDRMAEYADTQTYERLAELVGGIYERTLAEP